MEEQRGLYEKRRTTKNRGVWMRRGEQQMNRGASVDEQRGLNAKSCWVDEPAGHATEGSLIGWRGRGY